MQRAAAANVSSSKTPESSSQSKQPNNGEDLPSPKRQKLSADTSAVPNTNTPANIDAISTAIKAEEEKRSAAVAKQAAEAGETEWVLQFPENTPASGSASDYRNGNVGQAYILPPTSLDADDFEAGEDNGRRGYGNFKSKRRARTWVGEGEEEEEVKSDDAEDPQLAAMIRDARSKSEKDKKKGGKGKTRRDNEGASRSGSGNGAGAIGDNVDLSKLSSISGGMNKVEKRGDSKPRWKGDKGRR